MITEVYAGMLVALPRVELLSPPSRLFIGGEPTDAASGARFDNISPRDGSVLNRVAEGGPADIDRAVAAARRAFEDGRWRDLKPAGKKRVLFALAERMEAEADRR